MKLSEELLSAALTEGKRLQPFADELCRWYTACARELPWRSDASPYHVWISEIMLQQTRIEAVLPYYASFLQVFPDVAALAAAPSDMLMKQWEGLGYYSRARNLQKAAVCIMQEHGGEIPADYASLLALPGIGEYTAGAIASIAFGLPEVAVDGNVMRVLARLTGAEHDVLTPLGKQWFSQVARSMLPKEQPGAFNSALMELGERVCLPNTMPHCEECPLREACAACRDGRQTELPVRVRKVKRRIERKTVLIMKATDDGSVRVLLHRRPDTGLLAGLWELPNFDGVLSEEEVRSLAASLGGAVCDMRPLPEGKHIFTHIEWHMTGWLLSLEASVGYPGGEWVTLEEYGRSYALPSAFRTYTALLPVLMEGDYA